MIILISIGLCISYEDYQYQLSVSVMQIITEKNKISLASSGASKVITVLSAQYVTLFVINMLHWIDTLIYNLQMEKLRKIQ